jgi:hypothetical protein
VPAGAGQDTSLRWMLVAFIEIALISILSRRLVHLATQEISD